MPRSDAFRANTFWERLAVPLGGLSAATFGALSAARRNRVFHPVGEAYTGSLDIWGGTGLHLPNGTHDVLVRFSRGIGLPEPLPDVLGLAIKIPATGSGYEQDLLLASSGSAIGTRHLLVPVRNFLSCSFSSVLPYRPTSEQVVFGARADVASTGRDGDFGTLDDLAAQDRLRFDILVAEVTGPWEQIGSLLIGGHCDQTVSRELRFNPWNTHPQLQPAGPLNTLRRSAYVASQEARPDTE